jgi:hypothetical protein
MRPEGLSGIEQLFDDDKPFRAHRREAPLGAERRWDIRYPS